MGSCRYNLRGGKLMKLKSVNATLCLQSDFQIRWFLCNRICHYLVGDAARGLWQMQPLVGCQQLLMASGPGPAQCSVRHPVSSSPPLTFHMIHYWSTPSYQTQQLHIKFKVTASLRIACFNTKIFSVFQDVLLLYREGRTICKKESTATWNQYTSFNLDAITCSLHDNSPFF